MPTVQNPYTGTVLTFTTPSGGLGVGGIFDPSRDYAPNGNWAFSGSIGLNPGAMLQESFQDNITAKAGGTQANGTQLNNEMNRLGTVASAGDSVVLPASQAGLTIFIINHGAAAAQVYGFGTDTIDDIATATGVSQMANSVVLYTCVTAGKWYSEGLATGFSTSSGNAYQTLSVADGITPFGGGGQASAVLLTKMVNRSSSGAANDSVKLPAAQPGMQVTYYNGGANSINVFPQTGEQINALGANAAFAVATVVGNIFTCFTAGQWFSK